MDRLDMSLALIHEAKKEKELLEMYNKEQSKLPSYDSPDYDEDQVKRFWMRWTRIPKKSIVNDNIKMARRLLLNEYVD